MALNEGGKPVVRETAFVTGDEEMNLRLSAGQRETLIDVLSRALSDLREEVYKTENYDLRQQLKEREQVLQEIITQLNKPIDQP